GHVGGGVGRGPGRGCRRGARGGGPFAPGSLRGTGRLPSHAVRTHRSRRTTGRRSVSGRLAPHAGRADVPARRRRATRGCRGGVRVGHAAATARPPGSHVAQPRCPPAGAVSPPVLATGFGAAGERIPHRGRGTSAAGR